MIWDWVVCPASWEGGWGGGFMMAHRSYTLRNRKVMELIKHEAGGFPCIVKVTSKVSII